MSEGKVLNTSLNVIDKLATMRERKEICMNMYIKLP